jgi:hypothetical protein
LSEGEVETRTVADEMPPERSDDRPAGRGRGRARRKRDEEVEQDEDQEVAQEPRSPATEEDDEDAELEEISTWNLPSWQELIASLYRPER